jgi:Nucleotidyltransferase domain
MGMPSVPQGLTDEQFTALSIQVRSAAGHLSNRIEVHGSRVAGTASDDSDLDIAILVSSERFQQILMECFKTPNAGSAREKTMQHARLVGKIQAGEAGLRPLRKSLEAALGVEVDISVIQEGSLFDQGPYLSLQIRETSRG